MIQGRLHSVTRFNAIKHGRSRRSSKKKSFTRITHDGASHTCFLYFHLYNTHTPCLTSMSPSCQSILAAETMRTLWMDRPHVPPSWATAPKPCVPVPGQPREPHGDPCMGINATLCLLAICQLQPGPLSLLSHWLFWSHERRQTDAASCLSATVESRE